MPFNFFDYGHFLTYFHSGPFAFKMIFDFTLQPSKIQFSYIAGNSSSPFIAGLFFSGKEFPFTTFYTFRFYLYLLSIEILYMNSYKRVSAIALVNIDTTRTSCKFNIPVPINKVPNGR